MDLLIEKSGQTLKLSDLGFYNITIDDAPSSFDLNRRTVKGRSGTLFDGVTFEEKLINLTARVSVASTSEFMQLKDMINGLLMDEEAYYITKLVPVKDDLYDFELPGQVTGELDFTKTEHKPWHYRFNVTAGEEPVFSFVGKSGAGLKYNLSAAFVTVGLPYGETVPQTYAVVDNVIDYAGTARLSQLEHPLTVELKPSADQTSFYLEIDGRRFTYNYGTVPLKEGDTLLLTGIETTLNNLNVNNRTNLEYFVFKPSVTNKVTVRTNFRGVIRLLNFVELYK